MNRPFARIDPAGSPGFSGSHGTVCCRLEVRSGVPLKTGVCVCSKINHYSVNYPGTNTSSVATMISQRLCGVCGSFSPIIFPLRGRICRAGVRSYLPSSVVSMQPEDRHHLHRSF